MMNIIEIAVSYNYGAWKLTFVKVFTFNFAPFFGLSIFDGDDDYENIITLDNTDYRDTQIAFSPDDNRFYVEIRNSLDKSTILDDIISRFHNTGWERTDKENIIDFQRLLKKKLY